MILCGQRDAEEVKGGLRYLHSLPEDNFRKSSYYFYGHYYAVQAMVQSGNADYKSWYPKIRDALVASRFLSACRRRASA